MDSILTSVKKMLGMDEDYEAFDPDLVMNINGVFLILNQLGVGPKTPFSITGAKETWTDFMFDINQLALVKPYMYLKVRLIFDPPNTGVLHEAMERQIKEFEWRLNVQVDSDFEEFSDDD